MTQSAHEQLAHEMEDSEDRARQLYADLQAPLEAGDLEAVRALLPSDAAYAVGLVCERLAREGDAKGVKALLECGVDPGFTSWDGDECLLSAAARTGLQDVVAEICGSLAGREDAEHPRALALVAAAGAGHAGIIGELLKSGKFDVEVIDEALFTAAARGYESVVELLLPLVSEDVRDELDDALAEGRKRREFLRPATRDRGALRFFEAMEHEELDNATRWLRGGLDLDAVDSGGRGVVHYCRSHPEVLQVAIEAGAPLDIQDDVGHTALMCAVLEDDNDLVQTLIRAGANLDLHDIDGRSALEMAADYGDVTAAQLLVDAGADCGGDDPQTLIARAQESHQEHAEMLEEGLEVLSGAGGTHGNAESAER